MDAVERDAVREGDGAAMMQHWRLDMLQFNRRRHCKYRILGHRMLAGKIGERNGSVSTVAEDSIFIQAQLLFSDGKHVTCTLFRDCWCLPKTNC